MGTNAIIFFLLILSPHRAQALSVGSDSAPSRQTYITFPQADTNNTILGFASMEAGFKLQNGDTTCTYNSFLPVSGDVGLNDGRMYLLQDLTFSNSAVIRNSARFYGNNHAVELNKCANHPIFPAPALQWSTQTLFSTLMTSSVWGLDWSYDNKYIVSCSRQTSIGNTPQELAIYYFDGTALTLTKHLDQGMDCFSVAWNPKDMHLALGRDGWSTQNLRIYRLNISNGTLILDDSRDLSATVPSVFWHPSGDDLVIGSTNPAREANLYSFSRTTGLLTDLAQVDLNPDRTPSRSAWTWAPGGNYAAIGTAAAAATTPNLTVFSFNGSTLVTTVSANAGGAAAAYVRGIDWCPTGTYIAVGLESGTEKIRIYAHSISPQGLTEVQTARVGATLDVRSVHWDPTGNYLLVSINAGAGGSGVSVYAFDKVAGTLTLRDSLPSSTSVYKVRWSRDGSYFAYGTGGDQVVVVGNASFATQIMQFKDTTLVFNADTTLTTTLLFQGSCKIKGNGNHLILARGTGLSVRSSSTLTVESAVLEGIRDNNLGCYSDNSKLVLQNTALMLSSDFTFSRGSIVFDNDVFLQGAGKFNYATALASTIQSQSMLSIDSGITFSYAPRVAKKNLIYMADGTASMFLNGSTLSMTRTGLRLSGGTLIFDNAVTLSSEARSSGEAGGFASDLTTKVLSNAAVNMFGRFKAD